MSGNQGWNSGGDDAPPAYDAPSPPPESPYPSPTPPPYVQAPPPAPPKPRSRVRSLLPLIVILVVAAVIGVGFVVFRDRFSNDVTSLALGECFDEPSVEAEISEVQRQPCNEAHDAEVIAVLTHPAPAGEAYPVVSGFDDYIAENCVPAFEAYLGIDWDTATDYDIGYFRPTLSGWGSGDRGFTCYVSRSDGAKLNNTVRAAGSSPLAS